MELLDMGLPKRRATKNNFGFGVSILDVSYPIDKEGEPPLPSPSEYKKMTKHKIETIIKKRTKKNKHIIHGARAVNVQVTKPFRRKTNDYDLWAGYSKKQADELEDELDKAAGGDMFYERTLTMPDSLHGGVKKIHQVVHRRKHDSVADYSRRPPKADFVNINDLRYESLSHAKKTKIAILDMAQDCNPFFGCPLTEERIRKTKRDLNRIKRYEKNKKKTHKKKTKNRGK